MKKNSESISLEQLRKMLHISKRKAAWMLQNGIIPCQMRDTATQKYIIKREDALAYLSKSEKEKRMEIPIGIFNAKPTKNPRHTERYCSAVGGFTYIRLRGTERTRFKRYLETLLEDVPDTLTVAEVIALTGYTRSTILRYIKKKYIYAVNFYGKYFVSKRSIINYLATDKAFKNTQKTKWHMDIISSLFIEE